MQQIIEIQGQLSWRVFRDPKSGLFIGVCDALRLTLEGESLSDLTETMDDGISAFLRDLVKAKEFEKFLLEHGWRLTAAMPKSLDANVRFDVPMDIHLRPARDFQVPLYQ